DFNVSKAYGMLPADTSGDPTSRTPADNQTVRNVFAVGPHKKVKLILLYPMTAGRNFDEVLRVIDSLQLTANHRVATPGNWQQGENVIIGGSVSNDEAKEIFGERAGAMPELRVVRTVQRACLTQGSPGGLVRGPLVGATRNPRPRRLARVGSHTRGGQRDALDAVRTA